MLNGIGAGVVATVVADRWTAPAAAATAPTVSVTYSDPDPGSGIHRSHMTRWGLNLTNTSAAAMADVEAQTGGHSDVFGFFSSWAGYPEFPTAAMDRIYDHGSTPQFCWQAQDPTKAANGSSEFSYDSITAGAHDAYLTRWATAAKAWGHVLYLRLFHEFNGNWYQWGIGNNGNTAAGHVAAWRHVRDVFTSVGAANVQFVWCPAGLHAGSAVSTTAVTSCYPGDSYVDWLGFDAYNFGSYGSQGWQTVENCLTNTYNALSGLNATKPIMLAEVGCAEDPPNDKEAWIRHLFGVLWANYPRIKVFCWATWISPGGRDNRIVSTPGAQAAFHAGTTLSAYRPACVTVTATDASGAKTSRCIPMPA